MDTLCAVIHPTGEIKILCGRLAPFFGRGGAREMDALGGEGSLYTGTNDAKCGASMAGTAGTA